MLIAVNRSYNKSDYIPCIAWGRNARYAQDIEVGKQVSISGRIQSREYTKKIGEVSETRIAYEVSLNKIYISGKDICDEIAQTEIEEENEAL